MESRDHNVSGSLIPGYVRGGKELNKVMLSGRLTRDPEMRYSQGERQIAVARYTLAVDRRGRRSQEQRDGEQTADFIQCVAFDRAGEFAERYLKKGTKIIVTGRIQTGSYTNRDGQRVYTTDVIVEEQEFAESKSASGENSSAERGSSGNSAFAGSFKANSGSDDAGDGFMTIEDGVDDEGLPFK